MTIAKSKIPRTRWPATLSPGLGGMKLMDSNKTMPIASHKSFAVTN
jgi:hypothetical protein